MSHETFLTTRDRIETSVGPSSRGITVSWGALGLTLGVAAALVGSGGVAVALAGGAAFSFFKATQSYVRHHMTTQVKGARPNPLDATNGKVNSPSVEMQHDAVPQLVDESNSKDWRRHVTHLTSERALRGAGKGF